MDMGGIKKNSETDSIPHCIEGTFHIIDGISAMCQECSTMITAIFGSDNSHALTNTSDDVLLLFTILRGLFARAWRMGGGEGGGG